MKVQDSVVLITGANRGLGKAFAREALARGARKVYATARHPDLIDFPGVIPVALDVTDPEQVRAVARQCGDVNLVINNAGIAQPGSILADDAGTALRAQLEVNLFGMLSVSQAFSPVLAANHGGAIINVLSVASWISTPILGTYAMTKSAAWSLTNGLRHALSEQHTQVLGLHIGFIDTDLTKDLDAPKISPQAVVDAAYDGLEQGQEEVLVDEISKLVHDGLSSAPEVYLHPIQR